MSQRPRIATTLSVLASALLALFTLSSSRVHAFDIEETIWGYDGTVIPYEVNPLFMRLRNNTGKAEEFTLSLEVGSYGSRNLGARITVAEEGSTLFLSPFTERWVTFYFYASPSATQIRLLKGDEQVDMEPGRVAERQIPVRGQSSNDSLQRMSRVLFTSSDELSLNRRTQLKRFPVEVFPPVVTGTDTLEAVFLDHVPRWQPEQRKTFMRWLQRGGTVHLLQSPLGAHPTFDEELAVLNGAIDQQYIGSGLVMRHSFSRNKLDKQTLDDIQEKEDKLFRRSQATTDMDSYRHYYYENNISNSMFPALRKYVNPDHNWPVLYLISFVYLFAVFPGAWIIRKKWADFRIIYGGLLIAVVLFAIIFNIVGARGYGESTQINSIAVAHVLTDDEIDVTQYSNAFVTSGGTYDLKHEGTGVIYSTASDSESVLGEIRLGPQADFSVDIPPFSSRPFLHRALINHSAPKVELVDYQTGQGLSSLKINIEGLKNEKKIWAIHNDRVSQLNRNGNLWRTDRDGQIFAEFLQQDHYEDGIYYNDFRELKSSDEIDSELVRTVIQKSLRYRKNYGETDNRMKNDRVHLFVWSDMPEDLHSTTEAFAQQSGNLLYHYELILSE